MIHVIIGTKAQLIKMAPILKTFNERSIDYNYITTGQHRETIDDILSNFGIKQPDYSLYDGKDITSVVQMLFWGVRNIIHTLKHRKTIFRNDKNGIVLVHGDTFSTLLGAVMGKIGGLKVAHIESGLRSFNLLHPFPEEITRILTFRLSDYMFCPGDWAATNLEKYSGEKINTGYNTLLDALQIALPVIRHIDDVVIPDKPYGVVTLHRFENIRNHAAMLRIIELVEQIALNKHLVFILHKPTEIKLRKFDFYTRLEENPHIELRQRYDYFRFIRLIIDAQLVVSDGGSNQEECHYLGKPVILLRKATERHEGLGRNCVLSLYDGAIVRDFINNLDRYTFEPLQLAHSPSGIIADYCSRFA
ncbi:UDP-N-acetylglucosamine 2-epimerase [Gammaproteobacteria bacterium]|nr:UDP-N-acetylglucosamine 2-epimerase [Gammaproteobacteria bacterium]